MFCNMILFLCNVFLVLVLKIYISILTEVFVLVSNLSVKRNTYEAQETGSFSQCRQISGSENVSKSISNAFPSLEEQRMDRMSLEVDLPMKPKFLVLNSSVPWP